MDLHRSRRHRTFGTLGLVACAIAMAASGSLAQPVDDEDIFEDVGSETPDADDAERISPQDEQQISADDENMPDIEEIDPADFAPDDDLSDDAIPVDLSLTPPGMEWVVVDDPASDAETSSGADGSEKIDTAGIPTMELRPIARQSTGTPTLLSVGGFPVPENAMPFMAELFYNLPVDKLNVSAGERNQPAGLLRHACGGALIAPNWVLTAAHCVRITNDKGQHYKLDYVKQIMQIKLGAENIVEDEDIIYNIDGIFYHDSYSSKPIQNDIALIRLKADARQRNPREIKPIDLPSAAPELPAGSAVTSTGWGKKSSASAINASTFNYAIFLNTIDRNNCPKQPGFGVSPTVICAKADRVKMCKGDSGSPLVMTNGRTPRIVGIVSWGLSTGGNCKATGEAAVYTQVQSFLPWINKTIAANSRR